MLITVNPADVEPVTLEEAKHHLRVDHDADDALIQSLITAARETVERFTGRALAAASYRWASEGYAPYVLPLWPSSVSSVSYLSGSERVDAADYTFDADRALLSVRHGATGVNAEFETEPEHVPEALKAAIKLHVEAQYDAGPEDKPRLVEAANALAWPYRLNLGV